MVTLNYLWRVLSKRVPGLHYEACCQTHLHCWFLFWAPQNKKDVHILKQAWCRTTEMIKELEHLSYEERLRAGIVQSGEEKAQGGYGCIFNI